MRKFKVRCKATIYKTFVVEVDETDLSEDSLGVEWEAEEISIQNTRDAISDWVDNIDPIETEEIK